MFNQLVVGVKSYYQALIFVLSNKLWGYFAYPIVVGLLLFYFIISGSFLLAESIVPIITGWLTEYASTDIAWLGYVLSGVSWALGYSIKIVVIFILATMSKYITLIVMSPIMALLSEKTEEIVLNKKFTFSISQLLSDIVRGVLLVIRNSIIEFGLIILCFFIPLPFLTAPFLLILSYYFFGFSMLDYYFERQRLDRKQSVAAVRKLKGLAIANGAVFAWIFAIPIVGVIIVSVLSPVAATLAVIELNNKGNG